MRIIYNNAAHYLHNLIVSLNRDPASFESWSCLHLHNHKKEVINKDIIAAINVLQFRIEGDLVIRNSDLFLIYRDQDSNAVNKIIAALNELLFSGIGGMGYYNLFHDYRIIKNLLRIEEGQELYTGGSHGKAVDFGEITALYDIFQTAKKLRQARSPQHVLIVEDDPVTRRAVSNIFKKDYALVTAQNAQEAITSYLLYAPDIVFLDIGLPDHSGYDVLRQIMTNDPNAYVVMFSSNSYLDNVTAALREGAFGFVAKPFSRERMASYILGSVSHHNKIYA
jgi:two-component system, chemotaxis family, chemotaxis protein CheY